MTDRSGIVLRRLENQDLQQAAQLWNDGWHDGHAGLVPEALHALRTPASFLERLRDLTDETRVAVCGDQVLGLCILKSDELYQMYVSPAARGTGVAQDLIADAEDRLRRAGNQSAWLACAIGNARAARFYEKSGWASAGTETVDLETSDGPFPLDIWRYEKQLN